MIMSEDRDNIRELLSAYIDGETTPEQSLAVEQEVARDPELALELHELTAARRLIMGLDRQRAPRGFVRKVMATAERKHLLGDQHAGGAFSAARWITMAVAAMVLLTAGIGIIAINMLNPERGITEVAIVGDGSDSTLGGGSLHDDPVESGGIVSGKGGGQAAGWGEGVGKDGKGGKKVFVGDEVLDYAVSNAKDATIYTHEVSNTLAVLHETLGRNDVQPLELEAREDVVPDSARKKREVSRGKLNFYYNNKQDAEQVQIVVLASDTVIEKLNNDLDRLASVQKVSQAPVDEGYATRIARAGPRSPASSRPSKTDKSAPGKSDTTPVIAKGKQPGSPTTTGDRSGVDGMGVMAGKGATLPEKNEDTPKKPAVKDMKQSAPTLEPVVVVKARPEQYPSKGNNNAAPTAPVTTPKPEEVPVAVQKKRAKTSGTGNKILNIHSKDSDKTVADSELAKLSSRIAEEQKEKSSDKKIQSQYGKINRAFRQQILNDDIRRNVQSQREKGINVQALVININRRGLKDAKFAEILNKAKSKPRSSTVPSPASAPATQSGDVSD